MVGGKNQKIIINKHSKAPSADLLLRLGRDEADVVLIQKPWLSRTGISGLRTKSHKLLAANSTGITRACLLIWNELNVFFCLISATKISSLLDWRTVLENSCLSHTTIFLSYNNAPSGWSRRPTSKLFKWSSSMKPTCLHNSGHLAELSISLLVQMAKWGLWTSKLQKGLYGKQSIKLHHYLFPIEMQAFQWLEHVWSELWHCAKSDDRDHELGYSPLWEHRLCICTQILTILYICYGFLWFVHNCIFYVLTFRFALCK